jgi:hypothetical protein
MVPAVTARYKEYGSESADGSAHATLKNKQGNFSHHGKLNLWPQSSNEKVRVNIVVEKFEKFNVERNGADPKKNFL